MQLSVKETAKLLNVSEKTVYRWVSQNLLPVYRVNHQYRFNRAELLEWASANRSIATPELFSDPDVHLTPDLVGALEAGGIFYRLTGKDKKSVLENAVELLRLPEGTDRAFVLQALTAREELGATGIGEGIAIPHPRNPIANVSRSSVSLFFLEHQVEFGSLDGLPVGILFIVISPTMREHVFLISKLSFLLDKPEFRRVIDRQGNRDEILKGARKAVSLLRLPPLKSKLKKQSQV